jgi:anti-anti-sigma factor
MPLNGCHLMTAIDAARGPAQVQAEASLSVLSRPAFTIARPEGDLDIATVPALRERLLGVLGPGVRLLIIDLSEVSFCDVSGLAVLIGTQRRARARGITIRLAAPRPQMAKLLRITGLDRSFTICATLDDARAPGWTCAGFATAPGKAIRGSRNIACFVGGADGRSGLIEFALDVAGVAPHVLEHAGVAEALWSSPRTLGDRREY